MVPLRSIAQVKWGMGPSQVVGFNGFPSIKFSGTAAPGYASGDAMAEMERLAAGCRPASITPGPANRCRKSSRVAGDRSVGAVAGLRLPVSRRTLRKLVDPAGGDAGGADRRDRVAAGDALRGLPNDVYFKVGLITIIGLSAKNAILIIEIAKDLVAAGRSVRDAAFEACNSASARSS